MKHIISFHSFSDRDLTSELPRLAASERALTVQVIACLAEFDRRRLYLAEGYTSLFNYCVRRLKLTEHEAYNRVHVARAVRRHPDLLERLETGDLSVTAVRLLAPHFTPANVQALVKEALGKNTEGIKRLIAKLAPQPTVPSVVRRLPAPKPVVTEPASSGEPLLSLADLVSTPASPPPSRRPVLAPLSESHYKLQVTISGAARERLKQIQDLMRHRLPSGDPAVIVEHALEVLHADLLKKKAADVAKPRVGRAVVEAKGRYIPASVRREVWRRDQGKCAFVGADGTKCASSSGVEFHHVRPYAVGGEASVENIEMRCRAHNGFEWGRHLDAETRALEATQR